MSIRWEMDSRVVERYMELARQMEAYEISQEEFAEGLTFLEGYPLDRLLMPGEDLRIVVKGKN
jgi:hypothetical protein